MTQYIRKLFTCLLAVQLALGPAHFAVAQTISAPSSITGNPDTFRTVSGVAVTTTLPNVRVTVSVTSGQVKIGTDTGLSAVQGYAESNWLNGAMELAFEGNQSNINSALATLAYQGTNGTLTSSVSPADAAYYSVTNNYYQYVNTELDWDDADSAAAGTTLNGANGYLATITSQGEMAFIVDKIGGEDPVWLGGTDVGSEGDWYWSRGVDGSGTPSADFWVGGATGSASNNFYTAWCPNEPNNAGGNEHYLQITFATNDDDAPDGGCWNDLRNNGSTSSDYNPTGYVIEYNGSGPSIQTTNILTATRPSVTSILRLSPAARSISSAVLSSCVRPQFTVTFNKDVQYVDANDFEVGGSAAAGVNVLSVTQNAADTYTLTLDCLPSANRGTVQIAISASQNIKDMDELGMTSTSIGNSEDYFITEAPRLDSITRSSPASRVISAEDLGSCLQPSFVAVFSESVTNVSPADFELSGSGAAGVSIASVSAGSTTFTISLSCLPAANRGSIEVALTSGNDIQDTSSVGLANLNIGSNQDYFITDAPVLNSITRLSPISRSIDASDLMSCIQPSFTAVFSEAVTNVDVNDFNVSGAGSVGVSIDSVSAGSSSFQINLSCIPSNNRGVIEVVLASGNDIADSSSIALATLNIDTAEDYEISDAPSLSSISRFNPEAQEVAVSELGPCTNLQFQANFSEGVQGVDVSDFQLSGVGAEGVTIESINSVSNSVFTVSLSCLPNSNRGSVELSLHSGASISDLLDISLANFEAGTNEIYILSETRVSPSEDKTVTEVVVASAEAPAVAVEKQIEHIQQRLTEQRSAPVADGASPDAPNGILRSPAPPPLTPTRKVEMVATRIEQLNSYFKQTQNGSIYFGTDSNALTPAASITLGRQLQQMRRYKSAVFQIEGHTDKRGSDAYNQKLGIRRARVVRQFFIDQGVEPERVQIVSFGEERPLSNCNNESCWQKNRRAQTRLVINEALQNEIGQEIEIEYENPPIAGGQASLNHCGLVASLSFANETGMLQDQRPVLCGMTETLSDELGPRWGVWTQGLISFGAVQNDESSVEMDLTGHNLSFGMDYRFVDDVVVGLALGVGENDLDGGEETESNTRQLTGSAYLSRPLGEGWIVNLSAGGVFSEIESKRKSSETNAEMTGARDGFSVFGNLELVKSKQLDERGLDVSVSYTGTRTTLEAFAETGPEALVFREQSVDTQIIGVAGTIMLKPRPSDYGLWRARLGGELQYDFSEESSAQVNFVHVPSDTDYTVISKNTEPLTVLLKSGFEWTNTSGSTLQFDYNYQQNAELSRIHSFSLMYRKPF